MRPLGRVPADPGLAFEISGFQKLAAYTVRHCSRSWSPFHRIRLCSRPVAIHARTTEVTDSKE